MTVFVLMCESIYDMSDSTLSCAVFDSLEKAQEEMRREWDETHTDWDDEGFVHDIGDKWAYHYLNGRYSETHCEWVIEERTVF